MFDILSIKKQKSGGESWMSIQLKDKEEDIVFWIDCSLIDGYGNRKDFKTRELFIDWDFNQYIFMLDNSEDLKAQAYQENTNNRERITDFIGEKNDSLTDILKGGC